MSTESQGLPPMSESGKRLFAVGTRMSQAGRCKNCLIWCPIVTLMATGGMCNQCNGFGPEELSFRGCAECGHPSSHFRECERAA